jgi:iron complex outermembrane recepter protein
MVSRSVAAVFSASTMAVGVAHAAPDIAESSDVSANALPEITVTAQRRKESIQDVPITIQALTGDQLKELSVTSLDDVVKYLPNVTLGSNGPGQGVIFMRGLSAGMQGNQSSATIATFPNVALYLDDQSMQFPARNVDVYFVDMERIEVLEGPQGTLYGGGAQAGAIRYITNKPKLNATSGEAEATYGTTAGGDPNTAVNAVLNVALVPDKFAVRAVIYDDRRGGYISNVYSQFVRSNTDPANGYIHLAPGPGGCPNGLPPGTTGRAAGFCTPGADNNQIANNQNLVNSAWNPVEYNGFRLSGLYEINNDWELLLTQSYQNMNAQGMSSTYPVGSNFQPLGTNQITAFSPAWDRDSYSDTSWTLNGQVDDLKLVYTGSYMARHIDQQADYTNYARALYGGYYMCTTTSAVGMGKNDGSNATPRCYSPIANWRDIVTNDHQSHEFRISTPDKNRLRGIAGIFWEQFKIFDVMNFNYKTIPSCTPQNLSNALAGGYPCVANIIPIPGTTATDPGQRGDATAFGEDAQRGYRQTALFGSVDYDLIPKELTATFGTRYYRYSNYETGSVYTTGTRCVDVPNGNCISSAGHNIDAQHDNLTYSGVKSRFSLAWHVDDRTLTYFTFSQGFRPGAFNRTQNLDAPLTSGNPQFKRPQSYAPDTLTNYEVGYKAEFLDRKVQFNATAYHMVWKDVQVLFFDPGVFGNTTFGINGPTYTTNGLELQLEAKATRELTLMGTLSYNDAKETKTPCLLSNLASSPTYGQCISQIKGQPFANPFGLQDSTPAFSPKVEFTLRARYDWNFDNYKSFVTVGMTHIGEMANQPASYPLGTDPAYLPGGVPQTTLLRYIMPGYSLYDAAWGISKDQWRAQLNASNLFNSHASTNTNSEQFIQQQTPVRPRVIGFTMGYKF